MHFILASSSPRRRELLQSIGLSFTVRVSDVPEQPELRELPRDYVLRLAGEKSDAVARHHPDSWVIAADTIVCIDDEILEKPLDTASARRMLAKIAGREHTVFTGVSLQHHRRGYHDREVVATKVRMLPLDEEEIAWYVATGEPMDKAGSYAVQGIGAMFVEAIDGNYTNVVGLPLPTLLRMLERAGIALTEICNPTG